VITLAPKVTGPRRRTRSCHQLSIEMDLRIGRKSLRSCQEELMSNVYIDGKKC